MEQSKNSKIKSLLNSHNSIKRKDGSFQGKDLISWYIKNTNPENLTREKATIFISENYCSPNEQNQLIYSQNNYELQFQDNSNLYKFIENEFIGYSENKRILNVSKNSLSKQKFFYQMEEDENENEDLNCIELAKKIRLNLLGLYGQYISDEGVDYEALGKSEEFKGTFIDLIERLSMCRITRLLSDENELKAFFVNLYNILNIHSRIIWSLEKKTLEVGTLDRSSFYNLNKYNIAGYNYSLDDIEHGILRNNYNQKNQIEFPNTGCCGSSKLKERFKGYDPRNKYCVKIVDPRIHFTLNCGAKSCPPVRLYEPQKLEFQFKTATRSFVQQEVTIIKTQNKFKMKMSQIFKWYGSDFGNSAKQILTYIKDYMEEEQKNLAEEALLAPNSNFSVIFENYNWGVNKK